MIHILAHEYLQSLQLRVKCCWKFMLEDLKKLLSGANVPFHDSDLINVFLLGYSEITIEVLIHSLIRLHHTGIADEQCISAILNGLNVEELKNIRPFNQVWQLNAHFGYHHQKFGNISLEEYQQRAINFMSGVPDPDIFQIKRTNGQYVRWSSLSGELGIIFQDYSLKTYYISRLSNRGWDYFLKQACQQN